MPSDTTRHERGASFTEHEAALAAMRERLAELQLAQIASRRRAIVVLEGAEGAGKKQALKQLAAAFDPCHFVVHAIQHDRREAAEGHWLARFWTKLPAAGDTAIFFRSWYRRVLDDRILGEVDAAELGRAFDEINEFEAQQTDYGTLIVKLLFEVGADVQARRLKERVANPWYRIAHQTPPMDVADPAYTQAVAELRKNTDTRWSPWRVIDGGDEQSASLAALEAVAEAWEKAMPAEAPHIVRSPNRAA